MGDLFDLDDDGQVSEEEEEDAFLLLMDDDDEEEADRSYRGGCLPTILLIVGVSAVITALPFLV